MKRDKIRGLLERKLDSPVFRARFEREYPAFILEVQMLKALERKGWTYDDLARRLHTSKANISRDLRAGGIRSATLKRVTKMAEALGMEFLPLLIAQKAGGRILPRIQQLMMAAR